MPVVALRYIFAATSLFLEQGVSRFSIADMFDDFIRHVSFLELVSAFLDIFRLNDDILFSRALSSRLCMAISTSLAQNTSIFFIIRLFYIYRTFIKSDILSSCVQPTPAAKRANRNFLLILKALGLMISRDGSNTAAVITSFWWLKFRPAFIAMFMADRALVSFSPDSNRRARFSYHMPHTALISACLRRALLEPLPFWFYGEASRYFTLIFTTRCRHSYCCKALFRASPADIEYYCAFFDIAFMYCHF